MSEKIELGKCPFCAASDTEMTKDAWGKFAPRCIGCGASGGWFDGREDAVETWNAASEAVERLRD